MNQAGELVTPRGSETMEQEEDPAPPSTPPSPSGSAQGVPTYGGAYTRYTICGFVFEVSSRYIPPMVPIGRGAYGIVCSARDSVTGDDVAIKKISNAFNDRTDAKRTLREILLLRHMDHPNVIKVRDVIRPPRASNFRDVYIVYDLMPTDLHEVIRSKQPMDERHYKFILYQLLRGLKYIHSSSVLHRDLKPPNILIDGRCNVKITDFGLARTVLGLEDHMTEYVVTRYYRPPELLLNSQEYSGAIDVWSLGCIYMELVTREILLQGENSVDQLHKTTKLVGSPSEEELSWVRSEDAKKYILAMAREEKKSIKDQFPMLSAEGADLIQRMLTFDPSRRITVEEALSHPYLRDYKDKEPVHTRPFQYDLSFEQEEFHIGRVRQLIYEQACEFNPAPLGDLPLS